jgi:hypothetical protein
MSDLQFRSSGMSVTAMYFRRLLHYLGYFTLPTLSTVAQKITTKFSTTCLSVPINGSTSTEKRSSYNYVVQCIS